MLSHVAFFQLSASPPPPSSTFSSKTTFSVGFIFDPVEKIIQVFKFSSIFFFHALQKQAVQELVARPEWHAKGLRILGEGVHAIDLPNGASVTLYVSPYTPEFQGWAFAYERHVDRFNPGDRVEAPVPDWPGVDLMVTHGPPVGVLDQVAGGESVGCEHLGRAVQRCRPRVHVFGHIHEGWGAGRMKWDGGAGKEWMRMEGEQGEETGEEGFVRLDLREDGRDGAVRWGKETVFVNASVMDVEYKPVQKMWMVDMDLPLRRDREEGEKAVRGR